MKSHIVDAHTEPKLELAAYDREIRPLARPRENDGRLR
jgi:hypothetical protein